MKDSITREATTPAALRVILTCHPAVAAPAVRGLAVDLARDGDRLRLCYRLDGDIARLRLPRAMAPGRRDGLWRHSCFEAFVAQVTGSAYREFNFAPSTQWAAYAFNACRAGMTPLELSHAPRIVTQLGSDRAAVTVDLALADLAAGDASSLRIGLCAVIEDERGVLSYWALAHPRRHPDFHDPAGFALTLPVD
jgi:hypothetical protein